MRVLLDENVSRALAAPLAAAGHDVLSVADAAPGVSDREVLAIARREQRCLLTFDSDFGDLVFQRGEAPPVAIVYLRLHPILAEGVLLLSLAALATEPDGYLVVVTREGMRRRPFAGLTSPDPPTQRE